MAISKVVYGNNTLIDLTADTVTADKLLAGYTAHKADGTQITGTATGGKLPSTITAGETPIMQNGGMGIVSSTSYVATGIKLKVNKAGTYRFKWCAFRSSTSSGTNGTRLYRNDTFVGSSYTTWQDNYWQIISLDVVCSANDELEIYARSRNTSSYVCAGMLTACIDWNIS